MNKPQEKSFYKYEEIKPPKELQFFLNKIWLFNSPSFSDIGSNFRILPDYTASLIFTSGNKKNQHHVFLAGPNTIPIQIQHFPEQVSCGFRFKPAVLHSLFGVNPGISVDKAVPLYKIIEKSSYTKLSDAFFSSNEFKKKINAFNEFIMSFNFEIFEKLNIIHNVIENMVSSGGAVKLESIYTSLTYSSRQFQRNFIAATGLSPKEFCKIVRFHTLAEKLVKNNFKHFDTLVEMGYYDQSHYYREFKEFTGMLPSAFESRQKRIKHQNLLD